MQPGADQRQACDQLAGQTGSGYFCSNGKCLAFCSNRTECSSADRCVGQTFLQQGGVCQTPCGLYDPASCPSGLHCSQIAVNTLTSELLPICVAGGTKTETETCVVDAATQNHDCTPGLFCAYADAVATATTCQRICRAAADCRSDQTCKANDPANPAFFSYCSPPRTPASPILAWRPTSTSAPRKTLGSPVLATPASPRTPPAHARMPPPALRPVHPGG